MRGVSLSQEPVFGILASDFVLGWKNIVNEQFVGDSMGYGPDQIAVGTTNGAGPHNVQMIILSADGVVVHALPGFWHPDDLAAELRFAEKLHDIWVDDSIPHADKRELARELQLAEIENNSTQMVSRSRWQGFDRKNEFDRLKDGPRDTFTYDAVGNPSLKSTNRLMHERMACQPFVPFEEFDLVAFMDYGRLLYDNNRRVDRSGVVFMTPDRVAKQKAKDEKRRRILEKREKARAERKRNIDERRRKLAERMAKAKTKREEVAREREREAAERRAKAQRAHRERVEETRRRIIEHSRKVEEAKRRRAAELKARAIERNKKLQEARERRAAKLLEQAEERRRKALERQRKLEEQKSRRLKKKSKKKKREIFTSVETTASTPGHRSSE